MLKILRAPCLWAALAACVAAPAFAAPLQAAFEQTLQREDLAGAVWSMVGPDGVRVGAAGVKNAATGERMAADSKVHVGSVTKTVLALGVLQLVSEGKLALDTPVAPLLTGLKFSNPWQGAAPLRVRHLLAQTSGLDNFRMWQMFSLHPRPDTPLAHAFAGDASLLKVHARPGSRYAYSNMSYTLLGMVIEAVAGERYERYLDLHLLRPLGMADSTFEFVSQEGPAIDPRLAMGHLERQVPQTAVPVYLRPATQFTTTAADMGRLALFLMGDGAGLVRPDLMRQLERPSGTEAGLAGLSAGHGLALATRDRHGAVGACHPGGMAGYRAMLCIYRDQGKAFFIAFNADSEEANYEQFHQRLVAELAMPMPAAAGKRGAVPASVNEWRGWYVPVSFAVSSLAWTDVVFNFVRLDWDGRELHWKPGQGVSKALAPAGGLLFQAAGRVAPSHVLMRSADGTRRIHDGLKTYEQRSVVSMIGLWVSLGAGLAGLVYVLLVGLWRCMAQATSLGALALPLASVLTLLLPVPFFLTQSFFALGDRTAASILLAMATGLLPLAMGWGLRRAWKGKHVRDQIALAMVLQCLAVLAVWGLIPFRLWH